MKNLQKIKSNHQSKYDEIIEYLSQDNRYWLENDKWDITKDFFMGEPIYTYKTINFSYLDNTVIKNEVKYYFLYMFKENLLTNKVITRQGRVLKHISLFVNKNEFSTFLNLDKEKIFNKWKLHLINAGIKYAKEETRYFSFTNVLIDFIKDFYDDREETEKDIWYSKNIKGAKIPASGANHCNNNQINFGKIPIYYREIVKRYFKTIITKKSWNHCFQILNHLNYFFEKFYSNGYSDGFIENLSRNDIENYLYLINNDYTTLQENLAR